MPAELTLLIFSRNDLSLVRELINELQPFVSEIVVIDSSNRADHIEFRNWTNVKGKVRIFYVPPLGYPDLLRPYSFTKCKNDWILLMDADERLNNEAKRNLSNIIGSDKAEVYGFYRFSGLKGGEKIDGARSVQIRLFNKNYLDEKGLMHKLPTSLGRYRVLPEKYHIIHLIYDKVNRSPEYNKIDQFSRISYGNLPRKIRPLFKLASIIRPFNPDDELTGGAYFFLFFAEEIYSGLVTKNLRRIFRSVKYSLSKLERFREFKLNDRNKLMFNISRRVNDEGMVRFLRFDSPETVEKLEDLHKKWMIDGSDFLIRLMVKQYAEDFLLKINSEGNQFG